MRKSLIFYLAFLGLVLPELVFSSVVYAAEFHVILKVKGNVQIKRINSAKFQAAKEKDRLSSSDKLNLGKGASALIMCSDSNRWIVPDGKVSSVSEGCSTSPKNSPKPSKSGTRSPNETIPYIISPRNTALLNDRPLLRWNGVAGATNYIVQIQGGDLDWKTQNSNTEIVYSGQQPLQKGMRYLVVVTTDKGTSSEEEQGVTMRFNILDEEKAKLVQQQAAQIIQQNLTPEAEKLALAILYRQNELRAEAISLLEGLVKQKSQTMAVYGLLGDLYFEVGLNQLAKQPYLKAWELAKKSEDTEGQADIEKELGMVEYGLGSKNAAREWFEKAKANYAALGDCSQVQELDELMSNNF
ncbi:tetratricopeptide repeat protein [Gloeothece verrucosa]|uniref:Tetratricopeptide repeat protein n=1 Tax=Gloeothece verrucosa (strain PCC 7822) TaxID=497965 RepID=E0UFC9_GLOV7|nr:tetratricopeptide repeat protein [Gloeothece verrucosa]ADN15500.1 conserved hypothetical protein [Gloeothece verrucosa PCC 7822]